MEVSDLAVSHQACVIMAVRNTVNNLYELIPPYPFQSHRLGCGTEKDFSMASIGSTQSGSSYRPLFIFGVTR